MNTLAPSLLFVLVVLSAVGPARAEDAADDAARARAVASMEMPRLARKLRARLAAADSPTTIVAGQTTETTTADAPPSLAAMSPRP